MLILAQTTQPTDAWYAVRFLNNTIGAWLAAFGILILTLVVGRVVSFILDRHGKWWQNRSRGRTFGLTLSAISGPVAMLIFALGLYLIVRYEILNLKIPDPDDPNQPPFLPKLYLQVCKTISALAVGWTIYRFVDAVEVFLKKWTAKTPTELDDELVPIIRKALRIFVFIVLILFIAQNIFKWNIGSLLAGLGIGGLAFALAAQDALKNVFGSIVIFADRPFQMGDRVKISGHDGIIEQVGFRSTRLRTLQGHVVTIPNAIVANTDIENIGRRPAIKRVLDVTITYDTPPEKVQRAVDILREMLDARAEHFLEDSPGRVYFSDFNAESLNLVVYYWFAPPDWWEYLAFTHEFNMELLRRYNEEGIEFAFPTRTLYVKQDSEFTVRREGPAT